MNTELQYILKEYSPKDKERVLSLLNTGFKRYAGLTLRPTGSEKLSYSGEELLCFNYEDPTKGARVILGFTKGKEFNLKVISLIQNKVVKTRTIKDAEALIPILKDVPKYLMSGQAIQGTAQSSEMGIPVLDSQEKRQEKELIDIAKMKDYVKKKNYRLRVTVRKIEALQIITVTGTPGVGKTYVTRETLENDLGMVEGKDYDYVGGAISPSKLFILLYKNRHYGKVTLIDEADETIADNENANLLKLALQPKGVISRAGKSIPFKGAVILITNKTPEWVVKKMGAVLDRGGLINYEATDEDIRVYIEDLLPTIEIDFPMTMAEKQEVFDYFLDSYKGLTITKLKGISIRTLTKMMRNFKIFPSEWKEQSLETL